MKWTLLALAFLAFIGCCMLSGSYSDMALIRYIHLHRATAWDGLFQLISNTTAYISFGFVAPYLILAAIAKKPPAFLSGKIGDRRLLFAEGLLLLCSLLVATVVVQVLKPLVHRMRPYEVYPFIHKLSDAGGGSFPSGHTADAFTVLAFFMLGGYSWVLVFPVLAWALAVGYSRICLGVHYGSDVMGAMVLGILSAWAGHLLLRRAGISRKIQYLLKKNNAA
ncbi:MAG TPA: phosphatase PAP2 family protein [Puia sp.]|uniref:phosphatase PAP2 family protein n=1 Tax=Puia sp. TaxID=2045100 RepID=UPI002D116135|nr:phosphatase PAP2 family protein [Puia sp.]HVU93690.1 phosphatase PAP2 family protein [Puia sp.]